VAPSSKVVLVVDDEVAVADTYALRLETEYETRVAYGGDEALETVDEEVEAILLDRRMPGLSGDEVLETLRDRGDDGVVVMTTAVDPDLNILEMEFDDYLCKPVDRETIMQTLEQHLGPPATRTSASTSSSRWFRSSPCSRRRRHRPNSRRVRTSSDSSGERTG